MEILCCPWAAATYGTGSISCGGSGGAQRCLSGGGVPKFDSWYQVTATHNDTTKITNLYVNGKVVATDNGSDTNGVSSEYVLLGQFAGGYYLTGYLDSVRIYPQALSSADVERIYAMDLPKHELASNSK